MYIIIFSTETEEKLAMIHPFRQGLGVNNENHKIMTDWNNGILIKNSTEMLQTTVKHWRKFFSVEILWLVIFFWGCTMCLKFPCIPVEIGVYWTSSQLLMCVCVCEWCMDIVCVCVCRYFQNRKSKTMYCWIKSMVEALAPTDLWASG